jgi:hypothetical protein
VLDPKRGLLYGPARPSRENVLGHLVAPDARMPDDSLLDWLALNGLT